MLPPLVIAQVTLITFGIGLHQHDERPSATVWRFQRSQIYNLDYTEKLISAISDSAAGFIPSFPRAAWKWGGRPPLTYRLRMAVLRDK